MSDLLYMLDNLINEVDINIIYEIIEIHKKLKYKKSYFYNKSKSYPELNFQNMQIKEYYSDNTINYK